VDLDKARRIPLEQLHKECAERVKTLLHEEKYPLSGPERQTLLQEVMDEIFGLDRWMSFCGIPWSAIIW